MEGFDPKRSVKEQLLEAVEGIAIPETLSKQTEPIVFDEVSLLSDLFTDLSKGHDDTDARN